MIRIGVGKMTDRKDMLREIEMYGRYLKSEERGKSTVEKYLREIRRFADWLQERPLTKEETAGWKEHQLSSGYQPVSINCMCSALNGFLTFLGREDCRVRYLRIQRRLFRSRERELNREEYLRLLDAAQKKGRGQLKLLMETICAAGIRVSEVRYITMEAARMGRAEIFLKGKVRVILLPGKLCRKLLKYAKKKKISSGEIFLTRTGKGISRGEIWAAMKSLCNAAGVERTKVFPHNLRHLFARSFYQACRDVVKLADVLGHSSIETTRIYLISTEAEHSRQIERLNLVC